MAALLLGKRLPLVRFLLLVSQEKPSPPFLFLSFLEPSVVIVHGTTETPRTIHVETAPRPSDLSPVT